MDRTQAVRELVDAASRRPRALASAVAALLAASCTSVVAPSSAGRAGTGGPSGSAGASGGTWGGTATGAGGFSSTDAGPRSEAGPTEDANCGLQNFALDRRPAIVVLLQDRSTSMRNTLSGGATRWATVVDAVKPVLQQTQAGISWGFKLFPDTKICGVTAGVQIEPALNNAAPIPAT